MTSPAIGHHVGYDPAHFESLFSVEDRHFWFRSRNETISIFAKQLVSGLKPGYRVLEMGCGDGNVLRFLERACSGATVVGMDLYLEGLAYARRRTACHLVQGDVRESAFSKTFHLIGIFDVLEHIQDDERILRDLWTLLENDGALLLTVPAHTHLWSYFDEVSGHCRRYEKADLRAKLEGAGFEIEYLTEYMASLYPLMWLSRALRRNATRSSEDVLREELRIIPILNGFLSAVLSMESKWLERRRQLPCGTSMLAIARKRVRR